MGPLSNICEATALNKSSEVFLVVDSDSLSADELEVILCAPPDECWNVGDAYYVAGKRKVCKFNRWSIVERTSDSSQVEDAADRLVARLMPIENKLLALPAGQRVAFSICLNQESTVFGIGLSAQTMAFIGRIGAELDISVVVNRARVGNL